MPKFRKRPVVIDAVEWDGGAGTANAFLGERYGVDWEYAAAGSSDLVIPTLEGRMTARVGDWIVKGVKGEFYPCKPDIFAATYEPAHEWRSPVAGEPMEEGGVCVHCGCFATSDGNLPCPAPIDAAPEAGVVMQ